MSEGEFFFDNGQQVEGCLTIENPFI
jgi:hypothetical protein